MLFRSVKVPDTNRLVFPLFTVAVGNTVIVNVLSGPLQVTMLLVYALRTVMVAVIGETVEFVAVKLGKLPVPLAAKPMEVLLLVQLYTFVPPVALLVNTTAGLVAPLHKVSTGVVFMVSVGFMVIVKLLSGPVHVTKALV